MAGRETVRGTDLPAVQLMVHGVHPDADRLTAYQQLVGETVADALPAGFLHVLAFPVATAVMTRPGFPLPLLGMVHLANRVQQRRQVLLGETLDIRVHAAALRAHRKGATVDLVAEVSVDGTVVWRGESSYLAKGVRLAGDDAAEAAAVRPSFEPPTPTAAWRLGTDVGRRYATVSGDRNPIHTSTLAAKAFGFPRRIAHGMYTAARALADVGPAARGEAFVWEVEFARPVLLPSTVAVRIAPDDETPAGPAGHRLTVWSPRTGAVHVTRSPDDSPSRPRGRPRARTAR
jgi:acyl dehydratase